MFVSKSRRLTPKPGWAELDSEEIWQNVIGVLLTVANRSASKARILAIALATQGGTLIPAKADGTPCYGAITWMDGIGVLLGLTFHSMPRFSWNVW